MEKPAFRLSGFVLFFVTLAEAVVAGTLIKNGVGGWWTVLFGTLLFLILASGFTVVASNQARVVLFFGGYVGTLRTAGFHWTVPLTVKRRISLRVRNFESSKLKVSDADGNPVEIAAVVVWRVVDSAKAAFAVVVLCGDRAAQPVVNTGTLYS